MGPLEGLRDLGFAISLGFLWGSTSVFVFKK